MDRVLIVNQLEPAKEVKYLWSTQTNGILNVMVRKVINWIVKYDTVSIKFFQPPGEKNSRIWNFPFLYFI